MQAHAIKNNSGIIAYRLPECVDDPLTEIARTALAGCLPLRWSCHAAAALGAGVTTHSQYWRSQPYTSKSLCES